MSALHRAHRGAWASRREGFCSGVTVRSLSIQALKPFPELGPVSAFPAVRSLLPTPARSDKAVHDWPQPQERTARGCSGAREASRFSGSWPRIVAQLEIVGRLGVRAHAVIPHQLTLSV
jgi:hypothetical protein